MLHNIFKDWVWHNCDKSQIVITLKISNCDKLNKSNSNNNSKIQIVPNSTTLIKHKKCNCDKTQKLKLKLKKIYCDKKSKNLIVTKLKNSNCDKTWKQMWQKSKTQNLTNNLMEVLVMVAIMKYFSKINFDTLTTVEMFSEQHFAIFTNSIVINLLIKSTSSSIQLFGSSCLHFWNQS